MRNGRRNFLASLVIHLLMGAIAMAAAPNSPAKPGVAPVRLTVDVSWKVASIPPGVVEAVDLEMTEGQVVDALAWGSEVQRGPRPEVRGWRLGVEPSGRIRARLEAPLGASLVLRAFGQVVRIPLQALLDGQQRPFAQGPLEIVVERLSWDALTVDLEKGEGIAVPGESFPVTVGYNILTPEATEVSLRSTAELRPIDGGEPVWRDERLEVVPTNVRTVSEKAWDVPAPQAEGTYALQVEANWEPVASGVEHTRLGRWLRRRRNSTATSAKRRVTLVVAGAKPPAPGASKADAGQEVDRIDLARLRGQHPSASGRAPLPTSGTGWAVPEAALVEATRRDRLRGWITRAGSETAMLGPADANGFAWSALGLKVSHPGRPHRLTLSVVGGHPSALGVALVGSGGAGGEPRLLLDACASGPPVLDGGTAATFSWFVWPDADDPVLVLVNRDSAASVQLGTVVLSELSDVPKGPAIIEPKSNTRGLGLYLANSELLERFGGGAAGDTLTSACNLTQYLTYCGASSVVLPMTMADRGHRRRLDGQAAEDAVGPDRLDLLLRILGRQGYSAWLELAFDGPLPGLPDPASEEAVARGLVRLDRHGQAVGSVYHPLHPEVREAMKRRVAEAAVFRKSRENLIGLLVRLGPGPTLLGEPDTGFDDASYARFVREAFGPETTAGLPGLEPHDPNRFTARSQFLAGAGRMPWLTWRSKGIAALYSELTATARRVSPGMVLAVTTPGLDGGSAGSEARRVDLAGLAPIHAWRAVGLDLETWPSEDRSPIVLRGARHSADDLAHDLATSPELDALVVSRSGRGLLLLGAEDDSLASASARIAGVKLAGANAKPTSDSGLRLTALPQPDGAGGDELMGHALAALDPRWVMFASSTIVGQEERVRRFARVYRALPASTVASPAVDRQPFGVAVRTIRGGPMSYLSMANDTPYPIRLEALLHTEGTATVDDLGRGLRLSPEIVASGGSRVVLDLPPFGVAALRVAAAKLEVGSVIPHPSDAVLAGMQARYDELSSMLSKLGQAPGAGVGPPNPGFEPSSTPLVQLTGASAPMPPKGWQALGGMGSTVEIDPTRPHSGRGSLRVNASAPPAGITSDYFAAKGHSALNVQAWFRSDEPDMKVRAWIEGEAAGQPFLRWSELTIPAQWSPLGMRVSEIPPGGLDRVRLRFEMVTGGTLWMDDVTVAGAVLSEPERLNTRLVLMAAIHAYREKRYADFARLASSHWARTPLGLGQVQQVEQASTERDEAVRTGKATALPPSRLMR